MPANMRWLEALPSFPPRSALIVAGDVATAIAVTRQALLLLKARFEEVIWCPGNHELWLPAAPNDATLRGKFEEGFLRSSSRARSNGRLRKTQVLR